MTLVELLIVISIAVILLAVAIPLAKQPLERQKVRESSRQVNAIISSAQARAVELGRPVGVLLEIRDLGNVSPNAVDNAAVNATEGITRIHFAEVPPLYAGDVSGARVNVVLEGGVPHARFDDGNSDAGIQALIGPGDHIRFGYRGRWFRVTSAWKTLPHPDGNDRIGVSIDVVNAGEINWDTEVPFQIQRRPKKSVRPPVDLPGDTVIDLVGSGIGNSEMDFGVTFNGNSGAWDRYGYGSIMIMFQPSGAVERIHFGPSSFFGAPYSVRPSGPIHLLIGRADQVIPSAPFDASGDEIANLRDPESLWVSVGHTTGRITTTENLPSDDFVVNSNSRFTETEQRIMTVRELAMSSQSKGGR
jgi:type II secretory pathway pseudopilin PulG